LLIDDVSFLRRGLTSLFVALAINRLKVVVFPKIFPALQRDRHIAIFS